jgi:two-component system sensor histidine kinase KdpD
LRQLNLRRHAAPFAVALGTLAVATVAVAILRDQLGVPNPASVYLAAVVATALATGTRGAVGAAVASFLLYDFLFVEPRYAFTVADPGEWLNLVLLLFVGIVVGQLTALQRSRTEVAQAREREALALFRVSRALATRPSTAAVLPTIAGILREEARMERVWIGLGPDEALERVAADTAKEPRPAPSALVQVLRRMPGDVPARWVRVHQPGRAQPAADPGYLMHRVRIEAGGSTLGSVWSLRRRDAGRPDATETRLLSAAADQVGQALDQDRLAAEARAAEVARESDALKSALLQGVSHDLRTPLATIRAAAGTLRPDVAIADDERHESVDAIDREVEYLNRLVTNLLDLSRIEAGALRADLDVFALDDLVGRTLDRFRPRLGGRPLEVDLDAPPVEVDPVFLDATLTNALENALKYTPPGTPIRIVARADAAQPRVRLTLEDGGSGVPEDLLPRIFEKFYRVPGGERSSRSGTGIGLAVARGLVEAMGGSVTARRSELGGLAIDVDLPSARPLDVPTNGDRA